MLMQGPCLTPKTLAKKFGIWSTEKNSRALEAIRNRFRGIASFRCSITANTKIILLGHLWHEKTNFKVMLCSTSKKGALASLGMLLFTLPRISSPFKPGQWEGGARPGLYSFLSSGLPQEEAFSSLWLLKKKRSLLWEWMEIYRDCFPIHSQVETPI